MSFVYHFKPSGMQGQVLMPLNRLKEKWPEAYAEQVKKYAGRERLLEKTVPPLGCLWNDVLHFSPVNPQIIVDAWREHGWSDYVKTTLPREVFRIPVAAFDPASTACFQSYNFDYAAYDERQDRIWMFEPEKYAEQTQVSENQLKAWRMDFEAGRRFFWFSHTLHVLAKQTVDTRGCELFTCK